MNAEKHEVIAGIKNKEVKKVGYILNNAMETGYIGLIGNEKTLSLCGYDSDEIFNRTPEKKGIMEKIGLGKPK